MRKKLAVNVVILLLFLAILPTISLLTLPIQETECCDSPQSISMIRISEDTVGSNLTWTSRTEGVPQPIANNSQAIGDHVTVNGTFPQILNVIECELIIWNPQTGVNTTITSLGSSIEFDTYYLDKTNQTYNIKVNGTTATDDSVSILRENVTICNFFKPDITISVNPHPGDDFAFNISWICEDENQDDIHYSSVWLSFNDGVSFNLLAQNVSISYYIWFSRGFTASDYIIRVRAHSVDFSSSECRVDDPPSSYWPGDFSDVFSYPFDAGTEGRARFSINTDALAYEFGSQYNHITVFFYWNGISPPSASISFYVSNNGSRWIDGQFYPSGEREISIEINIDGLSIGNHEILVNIGYFSPYNLASVTVTVTPSTSSITNTTSSTTTTNTSQDWSSLVQALTIGVSLGSITIIVLVIVLSLRLKRNQVVEFAMM